VNTKLINLLGILLIPASIFAIDNFFVPPNIEAVPCTCFYRKDSVTFSNVFELAEGQDLAIKLLVRDTSTSDIVNDSAWGLEVKYQLGFPFPLSSSTRYFEGAVDTSFDIMGQTFGLNYTGSADTLLVDSLQQSEADTTSWDQIPAWLAKGYAVPNKDYGAGIGRFQCKGLSTVKDGSWVRAVFYLFFRKADPMFRR